MTHHSSPRDLREASPPAPCVALVGPADLPEFASTAALLRSAASCLEFANPQAALAAGPGPLHASPLLEERLAAEPVWGVLFEATPGCWSAAEAAALAARWPLCGWTSVYSDLCGGDERAGKALPGVRRIPWLRAAAAFDLDLWDFAAGRLPAAQRPASFTAEDHAFADASAPLPASRGTVRISARGRAGELLAAAVRACGWTLWEGAALASPPDLVLLDADAPPEEESFAAARAWGGPWWVVGSFRRLAEVEAWRRAGAAEVLARPLPLREFSLRLLRFRAGVSGVPSARPENP